MSDLDLSLDDCLDLLGAGRNHKARLELEALRTAYATVQAERDKWCVMYGDAINSGVEIATRLAHARAELATLRETLVGEIEALKEPFDETDVKFWIRRDHQTADIARNLTIKSGNAALDRAITIIKGTP